MNGWLASGRELTLNVRRPLIKNIGSGSVEFNMEIACECILVCQFIHGRRATTVIEDGRPCRGEEKESETSTRHTRIRPEGGRGGGVR